MEGDILFYNHGEEENTFMVWNRDVELVCGKKDMVVKCSMIMCTISQSCKVIVVVICCNESRRVGHDCLSLTGVCCSEACGYRCHGEVQVHVRVLSLTSD